MVERLSHNFSTVAETFTPETVVSIEQAPNTEIPSQPLALPTIQLLIALPPIQNYGNVICERLRQASATTAPPKFEDAFARFEPMFHTVFYRRYPYHELDDAKQNALFHLWKLWKKDMRILEQSAAYVVQAAVWGASPHRKIQKDKKRQEHELPMLKYERYVDIKVADQSRDPGWVLHSDMRVDIERAIQTLRNESQTQPDGEAILGVIDDVIRGRSIKDGQKRSELSTRKYSTTRSDIVLRLKELLKEYA